MIPDLPDIDKKTLCYLNNEKLKAARVKLPLTAEQVLEIEKCSTDIIYFVKNYVKIVTLDEGIQNFHLYPYQEEWIESCYNNRFVMGKWSRQSGKCVSPESKIQIRHKKSGQEMEVSMAEFHKMLTQ